MSLLIRIDRYLRETGMPPTKFGRCAINDPRLIGDLRHGRILTERTRCRIEMFMANSPCR